MIIGLVLSVSYPYPLSLSPLSAPRGRAPDLAPRAAPGETVLALDLLHDLLL